MTGFRSNEWIWSADRMAGTAPITATITISTPGLYTLNVWGREDGFRLDRILLALNPDYAPTGGGPVESQQGGTASQYLYGLGQIGEQRGGTGPSAAPPVWQYHLPDALGSVRQVAGAEGQVTLARHYDPLGGLLATAGIAGSAYGFAGEEQDPQRGHVYLRARTYAPETGRFLQQDSVLGTPGRPGTLHRYNYAFNNPINYTDPSGGGGGMAQASGGPASPFFNGPERSVNNGGRSAYSNPLDRMKSQGLRPLLCGMAGMMAQGLEWAIQNPDIAIGAAIIAGAIVLTGGAAIPAIVVGAAIGAAMGYGFQVYDNYQEGMSAFEMFYYENIDWSGVGRAAFHGAVSGAVAGVLMPVIGSIGTALGRVPGVGGLVSRAAGTTLGKMGITAGTEFVIGRAQRVAINVVNGGLQNWNDNLWNPQSREWRREIALDIVPGVTAVGLKAGSKGFRNIISETTDRWRLTQRLDDFVTRGRPVNPLNRLKADVAAFSRQVVDAINKGADNIAQALKRPFIRAGRQSSPADYHHLLNNLQLGGFSKEQSEEIVHRLLKAGVSSQRLKSLDEIFAEAKVVEVTGEYFEKGVFKHNARTKTFQLAALVDDGGNQSLLVWRFATEDSPFYGLRSNFSMLDPDEQGYWLKWSGRYAEELTFEEHYKNITAIAHSMGDRKRSPWLATGGHLAPIIRTTDEGTPDNLFDQLVPVMLGPLEFLQVYHKFPCLE